MVCMYCGNVTEVYNSRERALNPSIWRRRRCLTCVAQFSTEELPDYASALVVKGPDGKLYPFSRDKLFLSLYNSLAHRDDALQSATELTATAIGKLLRTKQASNGVPTMNTLAKTVYPILKRYDPLAANTYKAYHQAVLR